MSMRTRSALGGLVLGVMMGGAAPGAGAATETELQSAVYRAKPAVVMVAGRMGGTASVRRSGAPGAAGASTETELESAVYRARPAVVMVAVRMGGTASVRCSDGPAVTVRPAAIGELGSGSIVHPDGWIVTNGHVVQPYQEGRDGAFGAELLEKAIGEGWAAALGARGP